MSSRSDFANVADAHSGVEEQRLLFSHDKVGNCFFRLMRFVNGEDLGNDLIDLEPRISDRDTLQRLIFGAGQGAAPLGFVGLGRLCA